MNKHPLQQILEDAQVDVFPLIVSNDREVMAVHLHSPDLASRGYFSVTDLFRVCFEAGLTSLANSLHSNDLELVSSALASSRVLRHAVIFDDVLFSRD